jgi:hypothetical protein
VNKMILAILAASFACAEASAQTGAPQSKNRIVCETIRDLEKVTALAKRPSDYDNIVEFSAAPTCSLYKGKGPMQTKEIGQPIGWLVSNNVIILVHGFRAADGRGLLHVSRLLPRNDYRFPDGCGVFPARILLPTGEKYRFFGTNGAAVPPACVNLVNRVAEANELNRPPVFLKNGWVSRPESRAMNTCTRIDGLVLGLDRVVNEQQINNSSTDIFPRKMGCVQRAVDNIVASRFVGLYQSNEGGTAPQFWFEIHHVAYVSALSQNVVMAYMPVRPLRAKFMRMGQSCITGRALLSSNTGSMQLYGAFNFDVEGVAVVHQGRNLAVPGASNTVVGKAECLIGTTWRRGS